MAEFYQCLSTRIKTNQQLEDILSIRTHLSADVTFQEIQVVNPNFPENCVYVS